MLLVVACAVLVVQGAASVAAAVDMHVAVAGRMGFEEVMLVVVDLVAFSVAVSVVVVAFSSAASAMLPSQLGGHVLTWLPAPMS